MCTAALPTYLLITREVDENDGRAVAAGGTILVTYTTHHTRIHKFMTKNNTALQTGSTISQKEEKIYYIY